MYEVNIIKYLDKVWCCVLKITKDQRKENEYQFSFLIFNKFKKSLLQEGSDASYFVCRMFGRYSHIDHSGIQRRIRFVCVDLPEKSAFPVSDLSQ